MDVIVVGAGAAGLMVARELARAKHKVIVLEARDRIGGRIHTVNLQRDAVHIEGGAEFVHGNLPLTLQLLKEANIDYEQLEGDIWQVNHGEWKREESFLKGEQLLIDKLKKLKDNISISAFLKRAFPGDEHADLKQSLRSYVEGYYSGDPEKTSALSFYKEWQTEDEQQYRPKEGYGKMIQHLADQCSKAGGIIQTSTVVKEIRWYKGLVEVFDEAHHSYNARKVIITVPLGVLTADAKERGAITFSPAIPESLEAAGKLGFGAAVKISLQFKNLFWEDENLLRQKEARSFGFIFSEEAIGTWWNSLPTHSPILTGWIAGPKAAELKNIPDEVILEQAVNSLCSIFGVSSTFLQERLLSWHVFNWPADPFTRGSYTYTTTETFEAKKILSKPIEDTLYFAGEALYNGLETGTVEAALTSGKQVAKQVLKASARKIGAKQNF